MLQTIRPHPRVRAPTFPTGDTSLRVDCSKLGPHSQLAHVVAPRSRVDCAPAQLLGLPHLETLVLSGSRVRGSLPANLSTATRLKHLVVNGLGLYGTVSALPPTMVNLYLHDNRLSCRLPEADVPGLKQALVLVGNRFSTPLPAWMRGSYDFDWAAFTTATDSGLEELALFDVGLPALLLLASVLVFCAPCGRTATPPGGCEQEAAAPYWRLQLSLIKVLGALAVVACAALLPIFVTHSGFRVCGQLETTASASLLSGGRRLGSSASTAPCCSCPPFSFSIPAASLTPDTSLPRSLKKTDEAGRAAKRCATLSSPWFCAALQSRLLLTWLCSLRPRRTRCPSPWEARP